MRTISKSQFEALLIQSTPWIDVRAPIEFKSGSVPGAINLPLLLDEERQQVGTVYKLQGQNAAIDLGHSLVSGPIREQRLKNWTQEIHKNPQSILYCYRGGLRSQTVQSWLEKRQIQQSIVEGGYKALRQFLLETLSQRTETLNFCVVAGPTGSGKTKYLRTSNQPSLDLEAIANHRGSAFGAQPTPQPCQADFENLLAVQILRLSQTKEPILIESESRMIGQRCLPDVIFKKINSSPRITLNISLEERVENTFHDYVVNSSLKNSHDVSRFDEFRKSVQMIAQKLGGARAQEILNDIHFSEKEFRRGQGLNSNRIWIHKPLTWYYDPLYQKHVAPLQH